MKFARWEWLRRTSEETILLDRHEAMKDCIERTDHATAKAANQKVLQ
jgi:DNA-binding FadR family transcriptional regulator